MDSANEKKDLAETVSDFVSALDVTCPLDQQEISDALKDIFSCDSEDPAQDCRRICDEVPNSPGGCFLGCNAAYKYGYNK